jgi:hypothetical protein
LFPPVPGGGGGGVEEEREAVAEGVEAGLEGGIMGMGRGRMVVVVVAGAGMEGGKDWWSLEEEIGGGRGMAWCLMSRGRGVGVQGGTGRGMIDGRGTGIGAGSGIERGTEIGIGIGIVIGTGVIGTGTGMIEGIAIGGMRRIAIGTGMMRETGGGIGEVRYQSEEEVRQVTSTEEMHGRSKVCYNKVCYNIVLHYGTTPAPENEAR